MHWILQENLFNEAEWGNLIATLERFKLPYSVHKVIPFIGELEPPATPASDKVICIGSYSMRHTAKKYGWTPGVHDLFDINFLVQKEHWGELLLNYDSTIVEFKNARLTEPTFVRPIDDSKYFAGRVFEPEEFNDWVHKVVDLNEDYGTSLTGDTLIQLCSYKEIYAEYRFWIVDRRIVTASLYKRGGKVIYSDQIDVHRIHSFVRQVLRTDLKLYGDYTIPLSDDLDSWQPHRAFVLDVCETPDGMKIVEINTINASGFYAGHIQDIVLALENLES